VSPVEFKSCLIIFQHGCIHAHTYIVVCKYVCVCVHVWKGTSFFIMFLWGRPAPLDPTLVIYRWTWNLTLTASKLLMWYALLRSHEARPGTDPPKSEFWEESTLLCPSQNFGRTVFFSWELKASSRRMLMMR